MHKSLSLYVLIPMQRISQHVCQCVHVLLLWTTLSTIAHITANNVHQEKQLHLSDTFMLFLSSHPGDYQFSSRTTFVFSLAQHISTLYWSIVLQARPYTHGVQGLQAKLVAIRNFLFVHVQEIVLIPWTPPHGHLLKAAWKRVWPMRLQS